MSEFPNLLPREWRPWLIIIAIGFISVGRGATPASEPSGIPQPFLDAARKFKDASSTNRLKEGEAVFDTLPRCPVISQRDTGLGTLRSYDYSKPSYFLWRTNVMELLGRPYSVQTNSGVLTYCYLLNGETRSKSWALTIDFRQDYAVLSYLRGPHEDPLNKGAPIRYPRRNPRRAKYRGSAFRWLTDTQLRQNP